MNATFSHASFDPKYRDGINSRNTCSYYLDKLINWFD